MFGGFNFGFPPGFNPEDMEFDDGSGGPESGQKEEVDNKGLYEILHLQPGASIEEVKKQYRKLARSYHPDKGGDPEQFRNVTRAYEVLSDEKKKNLYDKYGEKGLEMGEGGNPFADIFGFGAPKKGEI